MTFLLDTNIISELARPKPHAAVVAWLESSEEVAFSVITLEELLFGVERAPAGKKRQLRPWLDSLLSAQPTIFSVDHQVAMLAGQFRAKLTSRGENPSQADMLIAATAVAHGRILATRNTKHFASTAATLFNPFEA